MGSENIEADIDYIDFQFGIGVFRPHEAAGFQKATEIKDSDVLDGDGFFVQEYTMHILPAIYPDESLSNREAKRDMKNKNYEVWVKTYEEFYGKPLKYGEV